MNIYEYIKNIYTKGKIFAKSVEIKATDDFNKLINMFFQPNLSKNITATNNFKKNLVSWLIIGATVCLLPIFITLLLTFIRIFFLSCIIITTNTITFSHTSFK